MGRSAWLVRNLYRKGRGKPWLSTEDAGTNRTGLRLAGHEAQRASAEPQLSVSLQPPLTESARASYDAISKLNIVDNVAKVTLAFYERLGLNPQQSPVYRCLASVRSKLAEEVEARGAISTGSSLERFELAWRAYEAGKTHEALQLFGEVIADEQLARGKRGRSQGAGGVYSSGGDLGAPCGASRRYQRCGPALSPHPRARRQRHRRSPPASHAVARSQDPRGRGACSSRRAERRQSCAALAGKRRGQRSDAPAWMRSRREATAARAECSRCRTTGSVRSSDAR